MALRLLDGREAVYARPSVVVVPLVPNDVGAGVTVILEAMAKAFVVTPTEGLADMVEHNVTGVTLPSGDAALMREAAGRLLANPSERRRFGDDARQAVKSRFGLDLNTDRLASHLDEICHAAARIDGIASYLSARCRENHH